MKIRYVWEHNGNDTLLFAADFPGAYARGASRDEALAKLPDELRAFLRWTNAPVPAFDGAELVQEQESALQISDADSDVLFASEPGAADGGRIRGAEGASPCAPPPIF